MSLFVQFFIFATIVTIAYGTNDLNVTSGAQDYFKISQRELLHEIEIAELKIAAVDARYADRLDVIQYEQQQVLNEIQQVNQTLMPLQALNLVRKHCIQKYDSQLITYDNARLRLKNCYDKAESSGNSLTSNARSSVNSAKNYVNNQFQRNIDSCNSYSKNQTKLELCYIEYVELATSTVHSSLNNAQDQLEKSVYDASVNSQKAVQCSFQVERDVLKNIGGATEQINDCEKDFNNKSMVGDFSDSKGRIVRELITGKNQKLL